MYCCNLFLNILSQNKVKKSRNKAENKKTKIVITKAKARSMLGVVHVYSHEVVGCFGGLQS